MSWSGHGRRLAGALLTQPWPIAPACLQVEGCDADLHADKIYNQRKRLCSAHMAAEAVYKRDQPCQEWRFCFQCGKLEPLELFDGKQR